MRAKLIHTPIIAYGQQGHNKPVWIYRTKINFLINKIIIFEPPKNKCRSLKGLSVEETTKPSASWVNKYLK